MVYDCTLLSLKSTNTSLGSMIPVTRRCCRGSVLQPKCICKAAKKSLIVTKKDVDRVFLKMKAVMVHDELLFALL